MSREQWGHGFHRGVETGSDSALIGQYFVILDKERFVDYAGQVIGFHRDSHILVELVDWLTGEISGCKLFPIQDSMTWTYYRTLKELQNVVSHSQRRRDICERRFTKSA